MKNTILVFAVIALMMLLPLTIVYAEENDNEDGKFAGLKQIRENLRERFLNEESYRTQLREKFQNCVDENSTECREIKENVKETVRGVMGKICDRSEDIIARLNERIDNAQRLSEEEKEILRNELKDNEAELEDICSEIEDANATELKDLAKEMKHLIIETRVKFELAKDLVHARRVGLIIERAEHLETRLNNLNVSECNSTELPGLIEQFSGNVTEAREAYDEAKDLWQQFKESIKNNETNKELLREAQAKYKEAQLNLKEAHVVLKDIIGELKDCKKAPEEIGEKDKEDKDKESGDDDKDNETEDNETEQ